MDELTHPPAKFRTGRVFVHIDGDYRIKGDYTLAIGGYRFGFTEGDPFFVGTRLRAGPFGDWYNLPVSAAGGWVIVTLLLVAILVVAAWLTPRRRRRE